MSGPFPNNGVPPGSSQAAGITYAPDVAPLANCPPLYFKTGCKPVVMPEQWNWLISNIAALVDRCGLPIDCLSAENLTNVIPCIPPCPNDGGCYELKCIDGRIRWVPCANATVVGSAVYDYIGQDQFFVVPQANSLTISAMGAAGTSGASGNSPVFTSGGPGGYAKATFALDGSVSINGTPLVPGVTIAVMVGGGGTVVYGTSPATYGFGGDGGDRESSGGGLSGAFIGSGGISNVDQNRAIVIGGGGGGGSNNRHGHGGGDIGTSAQPNSSGISGITLSGTYPLYTPGFSEPSGAGGGGGHFGGGNTATISPYGEAFGGSNFVHASGTAPSNLSSPYGTFTPPAAAEMAGIGSAHAAGITTPGQNGRVVFSWS
jgi:hypothetical protein